MTKTAIQTTTFASNGYLIDVVTLANTYEAWIYREEYGIKHHMFDVPKEQQSYEAFLDIVRSSIKEYGDIYDNEIC